MAADDHPPVPDGFTVLDDLGETLSSVVWLARHDQYGEVALKVRRQRLATQREKDHFIQEVLVHQSLSPQGDSAENVVAFIAASSAEVEYPWIATQRGGQTLENHINSVQGLSYKETKRLALGLLAGLAAMHCRRLVHGDIKLSNIVVANGQLLLCDLGLACAADSSLPLLQQAGGTPGYLAPELREGTGKLTMRSDVYAAAVVIGKLFAGQPIPASVDHLIYSQAVSVDPMNRPATANEFQRQLRDAIAAGYGLPTYEPTAGLIGGPLQLESNRSQRFSLKDAVSARSLIAAVTTIALATAGFYLWSHKPVQKNHSAAKVVATANLSPEHTRSTAPLPAGQTKTATQEKPLLANSSAQPLSNATLPRLPIANASDAAQEVGQPSLTHASSAKRRITPNHINQKSLAALPPRQLQGSNESSASFEYPQWAQSVDGDLTARGTAKLSKGYALWLITRPAKQNYYYVGRMTPTTVVSGRWTSFIRLGQCEKDVGQPFDLYLMAEVENGPIQALVTARKSYVKFATVPAGVNILATNHVTLGSFSAKTTC